MAVYDLTPVEVPPVQHHVPHDPHAAAGAGIAADLRGTAALASRARCPASRRSSGTRPKDFTVADSWGNRWIDWSSGVLITNAGHGRPEIVAAVREMVDRPLLATLRVPARGPRRAGRHAPRAVARPRATTRSSCSAPAARPRRTASSSPRPTPWRSTARGGSTSSRSTTPSTAARWARNWPAACERQKTLDRSTATRRSSRSPSPTATRTETRRSTCS